MSPRDRGQTRSSWRHRPTRHSLHASSSFRSKTNSWLGTIKAGSPRRCDQTEGTLVLQHLAIELKPDHDALQPSQNQGRTLALAPVSLHALDMAPILFNSALGSLDRMVGVSYWIVACAGRRRREPCRHRRSPPRVIPTIRPSIALGSMTCEYREHPIVATGTPYPRRICLRVLDAPRRWPVGERDGVAYIVARLGILRRHLGVSRDSDQVLCLWTQRNLGLQNSFIVLWLSSSESGFPCLKWKITGAIRNSRRDE